VPPDPVRPEPEPLAELVHVERAELVEQPQETHPRRVRVRPVLQRLRVDARDGPHDVANSTLYRV
jgi:hypothetical protein